MSLEVLNSYDRVHNAQAHIDSISSSFRIKKKECLLDGIFLTDTLQFQKRIGIGTYGLIYLVVDVSTGSRYAAKMTLKKHPSKTTKSTLAASQDYVKSEFFKYFMSKPNDITQLNLSYVQECGFSYPYFQEIVLNLRVHDHPNVITIHGVYNLGETGVLTLMDYYDQGDLFTNIIDRCIMSNPPYYQDKQMLMKNAILQLIEVISYCESKSVYHCDLKPENILVKYNRSYRRQPNSPILDYNEIQLILIDFGLSMCSNSICSNIRRGSSFYMAPERITNYSSNELAKSLIDLSKYHVKQEKEESNSIYFPTIAGDVWSIGVLSINIVCSRNPWPSASINAVPGDNGAFRHYIFKNKGVLRNMLPISENFNCVLNEIFRLDPIERIPLCELAHKIIKCDFFNDHPKQLPTPTPSDESDESDDECLGKTN